MELSSDLIFPEDYPEYGLKSQQSRIRGSYSTLQFVLRLRKDVRDALNKDDIDFDRIQATSTSIHENIHWWQHIGSNFGFLFTMAYPAFAHLTFGELKSLVSKGIKIKSIKKFDENYNAQHGHSDIEIINIILNNYHDLEYAKLFSFDNKNIHELIKDRRFFLSVGHCYHILWGSAIHTLAATIDRDFDFLPKVNDWVKKFQILEESNVTGHYVDSSYAIAPLGIRAIYEGQAIFNQMQYLASAADRSLPLSYFEDIGMLHGIYKEAFDLFLKLSHLSPPLATLDPVVGLFLLVCDLSINSNNGFPLDIYDYDNFIVTNDPGQRFCTLSVIISKNTQLYCNRIGNYSKENYIELSKELCESMGTKCSYESIKNVLGWIDKNNVRNILEEERSLKYSEENLSIRIILSKYIRFQEDKWECPHVFCWFGIHAASGVEGVDVEYIRTLFNKHHAPFVEGDDGEVKPVLFEGRNEENIASSFNSFYNFIIFYDIVKQWVSEEGDFTFDYTWLSNKSNSELIAYVKKAFKDQFDVSMDDIIVV